MHVRGSYDVSAMCLRATGLRFFQICHCAELNKIVEATMPVNPYDDRKVTMRRPHGNGDLDVVRTSYTRRKANVTEALDNLKFYFVLLCLCVGNHNHGPHFVRIFSTLYFIPLPRNKVSFHIDIQKL